MKKPANTEQQLIPEIRERWSPRAFDPNKHITDELLPELIDAARWAPSCFNEQPWRFLCFGHKAELRQAVEETLLEGNIWANNASHLVVITAYQTFSRNGKANRHHSYDAGAAVMSLILQAQNRNISTHQMAGFKEAELRTALAIPEDVNILAVMAVGYELEEKDAAGLSEKYLKAEKGPRQRLSREDIATIDSKWSFKRN